MSTEMLTVGDVVKVRFPETGRFRPAKVVKLRKKDLDIKWDNGTIQTIKPNEIKSEGTAEKIEAAAEPKKRGRKPKAETPVIEEAPKKRGRKPKAVEASTPEIAPKKRGRKPKAEAAVEIPAEPKKRGRKPKVEATAALEETPKKRGRKPKIETLEVEPTKGKRKGKTKAATEEVVKSKRGAGLTDNRATPIKDKDDIFVLAGQWSPKNRPNHHAAGHFNVKDRSIVEAAMPALKGKWRIIEVTPETRKSALAIKQGRIFESGAINVLSTSAPLIKELGEPSKKSKKEKAEVKMAAYKGDAKKKKA